MALPEVGSNNLINLSISSWQDKQEHFSNESSKEDLTELSSAHPLCSVLLKDELQRGKN